LKRLREAVGLSQAGLAENSGVPVGTIRDYEQGRRAPLLETAAKLARALKQPLESFLPTDDTEPKSAPKRTAGKRRKGQ
jgi:transcriptional regulator with XRE-family HTH domain